METLELAGVIITGIVSLVGVYLKWKSSKNTDKQKDILKKDRDAILEKIKETESAISTALVESISDVPFLRKKLSEYKEALKRIPAFVLAACLLSGCRSQSPVVIGERVIFVEPGQSLVVPALKKPARKWYLMDDQAMRAILGIDVPYQPKGEQ